MTNNLSDILLWIESPDNFNKGIGSLDSKEQFKKYSELISSVISKTVDEWMALGKDTMKDSTDSFLEMRDSISSLLNHFENQENYYEKDHYESEVGQLHIDDVTPPKGVSDEWLEIKRQERLKEEKIAVENVRKNKDAIIWELHTKRVILNHWHNELSDQLKTIKRSMVRLKIEANPSKPKISTPETDLTTDQIIENAFKYMRGFDPMKHKRILSDEDLEKLISWVKSYFANELTIPEINSPIKKIYTTRGNVYTTFKYLYRDFHARGYFPDSLYNLIKACFYEYRENDIKIMKKTSEPKHYQELIRKSE